MRTQHIYTLKNPGLIFFGLFFQCLGSFCVTKPLGQMSRASSAIMVYILDSDISLTIVAVTSCEQQVIISF